jgi:hypothetical protein
MIYILPTKRGMGVELWGTKEDLSNIYEVIGKFWSDVKFSNSLEFENRDKLISGFSYEVRKAFEGSRLKRKSNHFSEDLQAYFGCKISWVQFLFSLTTIKFNMGFYENNKFDISQIILIEFWLEKAMNSFDKTGAKMLIGYIEGGLYGGNKYIYQYMRRINLDYYLLGGGKQAFRKLPYLLKKGVYFSNEYKEYEKQLQLDAALLNCEITELELNDDDIDYEKLVW